MGQLDDRLTRLEQRMDDIYRLLTILVELQQAEHEAIQRSMPSNVSPRTLEFGAVMDRMRVPVYGSYCSIWFVNE